MAYQAQRFDREMLVPRHSTVGMIIVIVFVGMLIGLYELAAAGLAKMLGQGGSDETEHLEADPLKNLQS